MGQGKSAGEEQGPAACIVWKELWKQSFSNSNGVKGEVKYK